jgi:hypothetical protein
MGTDGFRSAFARGEPLADVGITFRVNVDAVTATKMINTAAEDFDVHATPLYDDPRLRMATASKYALERLFGWRIKRELVPNGQVCWWVTVIPPVRYPAGWEVWIENMARPLA